MAIAMAHASLFRAGPRVMMKRYCGSWYGESLLMRKKCCLG
jgi:hypothetical protein